MGTWDDNLQVTVECRKKLKLPVSSRNFSQLRQQENSWTENQTLNRRMFLRITHQQPSLFLEANSYIASRKFPEFCGNWNFTSLTQNPATGPSSELHDSTPPIKIPPCKSYFWIKSSMWSLLHNACHIHHPSHPLEFITLKKFGEELKHKYDRCTEVQCRHVTIWSPNHLGRVLVLSS